MDDPWVGDDGARGEEEKARLNSTAGPAEPTADGVCHLGRRARLPGEEAVIDAHHAYEVDNLTVPSGHLAPIAPRLERQ